INGSSMANSTAETPRSSRRKPANRCERPIREMMLFIARHSVGVGLVAERGGCDQETLATVHVGEIEAEQRHVDRPLVEQPHDYDVAGAARLIVEVVLKIALPVDRAVHGH